MNATEERMQETLEDCSAERTSYGHSIGGKQMVILHSVKYSSLIVVDRADKKED